MAYRIGVDVGGTFTDFLVTGDDGNAEIYKTSTTPKDPSIGFFRGLEKAAKRHDVSVDAFLQEVDTIQDLNHTQRPIHWFFSWT